ncbi:MAG: lipopolysaccharide biosynthesis protein [Erysipelotrichaceae bacterium]
MQNKVLKSLIWKFLERFGTSGIQFVLQIILARLLTPDAYGAIALTTIFISVSNVFVQQGFSTALIQQKEVDEEDYSSVFWISMLIALICYIVIVLLAPFAARFYKIDILKNVLWILGLTLFVGAYNSIQISHISRNFQFKNLFFSSLIGIIISGVLGIFAAYLGLGIWSIVIQQLTNQIIITLVLMFETKWVPQFRINVYKLTRLFKFGSRILSSALLDTIYNNVFSLVIGKVFSTEQLGYYNRADQFPNVIVTNLNGSIQSVMLPAMSEHQDDKKRVKYIVRKSMILSSYFIFPIMVGLAVVAEPLVLIILTDKWIKCVPIIQLLCFSYMLWPIHTANLQAINAVGRSDIYFKLEVIKKIVGILLLCISLPFGIYAIIISKIISSVLGVFINAGPNNKLLDYSYFNQFIDLMPSFFLSISMGIIVYFTDTYFAHNLTLCIRFVLDISIGVIYYFVLSYFVNINAIKFLKDYFKN